MRRFVLALLVLCGTIWGAGARADDMTAPLYPETRRDSVSEVLFGEAIADPYRWLEGDVRNTPEVADWVARQNAVSRRYLDSLPQRGWFANRIRALTDYERFGLPTKAGRRYFYMRNSGLQDQPQLFVREGLRGQGRLLIDPNLWPGGGTSALDAWEPSQDGKTLLYSVQEKGSDWRVLRLLVVQSGQVLPDEIRWVKFTRLAWVGNEGFLYSRFPPPRDGADFQQTNYNQTLWFHRIGTDQAADEQVYATPDHPEYSHSAEVTSDGRHAIIVSSIGTDARHEVHIIDLGQRAVTGWQVRPLVSGFDHDWRLVEGTGSRLWFITNKDAPRYRLVVIDVEAAQPSWHELVAQNAETLQHGAIIGSKLVLSYLKDASSRALVFDLTGKPATTLSLSGIGTASGFRGRPGDSETFYNFTSFNQPSAVFRLDLKTGKTQPFAQPQLTFSPADYVVDQQFFSSKDGTRVPMFIVRRKDIAAANKAVPTLLYGYGGFDVSLTPTFSAARMAWLEAGGAFALANLRGGGEYGWFLRGPIGFDGPYLTPSSFAPYTVFDRPPAGFSPSS